MLFYSQCDWVHKMVSQLRGVLFVYARYLCVKDLYARDLYARELCARDLCVKELCAEQIYLSQRAVYYFHAQY